MRCFLLYLQEILSLNVTACFSFSYAVSLSVLNKEHVCFVHYCNTCVVPTGLQAPPVSVTGHNLTSPRQISAVLFPDAKAPDPKWTLALMQYGQIITHDMSLAAGTTQGSE